jgi:hypothetical protein
MPSPPSSLSRLLRWRGARTFLLVAILGGLAWFLFPGRDDPADQAAVAEPAPPIDEPSRPASSAPAAAEPTAARVPGAPPTQVDQATAGGPIADPPGELPVWERPPRTTVQPFPEAARFDEPLPPSKVPAWMIGDAGTAPRAPAPSASDGSSPAAPPDGGGNPPAAVVPAT